MIYFLWTAKFVSLVVEKCGMARVAAHGVVSVRESASALAFREPL